MLTHDLFNIVDDTHNAVHGMAHLGRSMGGENVAFQPGHLLAHDLAGEAGGAESNGIAVDRQDHILALVPAAGNGCVERSDIAHIPGVPGNQGTNTMFLHHLSGSIESILTHTRVVDSLQAVGSHHFSGASKHKIHPF